MDLCRSLAWQGGRHEMAGFAPGGALMKDRPVGRGDVRLREADAAPWSGAKCAGRAFAAHEFHHATLENLPDGLTYAYEAERFVGFLRARAFRHGARD